MRAPDCATVGIATASARDGDERVRGGEAANDGEAGSDAGVTALVESGVGMACHGVCSVEYKDK